MFTGSDSESDRRSSLVPAQLSLCTLAMPQCDGPDSDDSDDLPAMERTSLRAVGPSDSGRTCVNRNRDGRARTPSSTGRTRPPGHGRTRAGDAGGARCNLTVCMGYSDFDSAEPAPCSCCCVDCLRKRLCHATRSLVLNWAAWFSLSLL